MNAIIGLGHLALKTDLTDKQRDYIEKIQTASQSLLTIINDILDFSKIEAGKLLLESVNFNLDAVMDNLGDLFRFATEEKNIELIFNLSPTTPEILIGDPNRLSQILVNLCSNAVKFTEQGEIIISAHPVDISEHKAIIKFSVKDTGCGIPEQQQEKLFDSFFQVDSSSTRFHQGTGLGLAICKQLVTMMNGMIGMESQQGQGSHFFFFAEFGLSHQSVDNHLLPQPDLRQLRILVVDDNPTARTVLRDQLASMSFKVTLVASAKEAYRVLETSEKNFELILMDWAMPEINGLEAVKYIRNNTPLSKIPAIIMVTAYAHDEVVEEAKIIGVDDFIVKPVTPSTLFDSIINIFKPEQANLSPSASSNTTQTYLQGTILLVEDNKINQQVAEELLQSFGLSVIIAVNGLDAVNKVTQQSTDQKPIDLVLMDIQMPEMDGIQATQKIRTFPEFSHLPIVAMTAHAMTGDKKKSLAAGMNEHITKPIDPDELYTVLGHWLNTSDTSPLEHAQQTRIKQESVPLPDYSDHLDIEWGLKRVGGNRALFSHLLNDFYQDHVDDIDTLQQALDNHQLDVVKRIIHTIKGVAGNIGARELQQTALNLEQDFDHPAEFPTALTRFKQSFTDFIAVLHQFNQQDNAIEKTSALLSKNELTQQIKQLSSLLQAGDPEAMEIFRQLQHSLEQATHHQTMQLEQAIDDYDFDLAINLLTTLCSEISDSY